MRRVPQQLLLALVCGCAAVSSSPSGDGVAGARQHGRDRHPPDSKYVGFDPSELVGCWVCCEDTNEPRSCVFRPDGAFARTAWRKPAPGSESPDDGPGRFKAFASWTGRWGKEDNSLLVEYSLSKLSVEARRSVNPRRGIIRERWQLRSIAKGRLSADIYDLALSRPVPRELALRRVADISESLRSLEAQERRGREDRLRLARERLEAQPSDGSGRGDAE